jgi:hypothetical protein
MRTVSWQQDDSSVASSVYRTTGEMPFVFLGHFGEVSDSLASFNQAGPLRG